MDEFKISNGSKVRTYKLIKMDNGDFRIRKNTVDILMLSSKSQAIDQFEKLKSGFKSMMI